VQERAASVDTKQQQEQEERLPIFPFLAREASSDS
jgi:hypothetical protein